MTNGEKELFEKKVTIKDGLILKLCGMLNLSKGYTGTIVCMSFNTPRVVKLVKAYFNQAKVVFMEQAAFEKLFGIPGLYYKDEGEMIDLLKSITGDLVIIANPPYGKIGANITKKVIDTVDFKEYVNLLPMIDYEKAANKYELWKHVYADSISACPGGFDDAGISPLIVKLSAKATANNFTIDEFRVQCIEKALARKYFSGNIKRNATFIITEQFKDLNLTKCIALPLRTKSGNHGGQAGIGKTDKSQFYLINKNIKQNVTAEEARSICCTTVNFDTELEKQNVTKLLYSDIGYRFASWLMTDMNRDAFHLREHAMWFPKVDWTRSWTVEEILADYGYTEEEIKEVVEDLKNYKGMED